MKIIRHHFEIMNYKLSTFYLICIISAIIICTSYISIMPSTYIKKQVEDVQNEETKINKEIQVVFKGEKIVHIDLKGAPPKMNFYKYLFPLLSKFEATGILLEYEDMFPYSGHLINISARNSYTFEDIKQINELAVKNNLQIIPLIQTFGHLEFILKLNDYKDLREVAEYPQAICPTHGKTEKLIESMVHQIVTAHPNIQHVHIGADEVHYLGICDRCTTRMLKYNLTKNLLYVDHIKRVVKIINRLYPHIKILIWDDQLRSITQNEFKSSNLNEYIEPVIWNYSNDVYDQLGPSLWDSYQGILKNVWIASAFKGATGINDVVSRATHYLENHRSWMSVISEYSNKFNFKGIIITGWQRYNHFSVLSELLPVGLPTLAMCLRILLGHNDSPLSPPTEIAKILKCEQPYGLIGPVFGSPRCTFPGGDILESVIRFQQLKQEFETLLENSIVKGLMSDYNIAHCVSSTKSVELIAIPLRRIKEDLMELEHLLIAALSEIYDEYTVEEWMETYVQPLRQQIDRLWNAKENLLKKKTWSRRPFNKETCK